MICEHFHLCAVGNNAAVEKGLIMPGKMVLVDITGGNTGVAIAMVARHRGY
jgi:cysteine synthase A